MKSVKNISISIFILISLLHLMSCSSQKLTSQVFDKSDKIITQSHRHDGSYERCSMCLAVIEKTGQNSFGLYVDGKSNITNIESPDNLVLGGITQEKRKKVSRFYPPNLLSNIKAEISIECDLIILKNGNEVSGKILEVGIEEIKYKKCEYIEGPTYIIRKSEVFMIKYSNGTKDVFNDSVEVKKEVSELDKKKALDYSEKYAKGQSDARIYHSPGGWVIAGLLLGILGVIIASFSNPAQRSGHNDLSEDSAYQDGYKKEASQMNVSKSVLGLFIWLTILLLIFL